MSVVARRRQRVSFGGRIGRNVSAQFYSQSVTLLIQVASIPLLIMAWGIETYGVWLLLTALPTYLTLSDFGFTFVAKNEIAERGRDSIHRGRIRAAGRHCGPRRAR